LLNKSIPVIFGCASTTLTAEEEFFFADSKPYGYILFRRNIDHPAQVKQLIGKLRAIAGWECPILIDQEGGRVARLRAPHWPDLPSMEMLVSGISEHQAINNVYNHGKQIGDMLRALGISVDCAPVCDLKIEGAHHIIGDRSFGSNPETVALLASSMCRGLREAGVTPVIKHIPGHGRALVDSHESLPTVNTPLAELEATDFKVFSLLKDEVAWAMTAHVVYTALDGNLPATLSPTVIGYIRTQIGFKGLLVSDDISMKALSGKVGDIALQILEAGCDIILHCNGHMDEMKAIYAAVKRLKK